MKPAGPIIDVSPDPAALAVRVAEWLIERMAAKIGRFALNLSGGSTPKALYSLLASEGYRDRVPWSHLHLFFGDERYVPWDAPDSNFLMVETALLDRVPIPEDNIHGIVTQGFSHSEAAAAYAEVLKEFYGAATLDPARPLFDVTLLGLGPDGHTASLFPGIPELEEREKWVVPVIGEKPPPERISMTFPVLDSSRAVAFLAAGAEKHPMLERVWAGDKTRPAARVTAHEVWWFVDEAAQRGA